METMEFRHLLKSLDDQLERVKKDAEAKQKREALEQHVKLVNHQISSFEARKAEFDKYGAKSPLNIQEILNRLGAEKMALEKQLAAADEPVVAPGEYRLPEAEREEIGALTDEVMNTDVSRMPEVERWLLFEIWATRWRIVVERLANPLAPEDRFMKRSYAKIAESIQTWKQSEAGWYIEALNKAKGGAGYNWQVRLDMAHRRLTELMEARRKEREADEAEGKAIEGLESAIAAYAQDSTDETYRTLCHGIRNAAKYEHLREDVAGMVQGWKDRFGEEFAFLWENGKAEEAPPADDKRLENWEIARRIILRLRNKGCIGASHAPSEKMWKGFPTHDQARAKECLEMLVKAGVIRRKNTGIGPRVSLEASMVARSDAFSQGKEFGVKAVDDWCRKEEA